MSRGGQLSLAARMAFSNSGRDLIRPLKLWRASAEWMDIGQINITEATFKLTEMIHKLLLKLGKLLGLEERQEGILCVDSELAGWDGAGYLLLDARGNLGCSRKKS